MAIYLNDNDKEHELLIDLLEKSSIAPWVKSSLIGRIQDDLDLKQKQENCPHEISNYIGTKDSCSKCGATKQFTWTISLLTEEGGAETHHPKGIGNTAQRSETTPNEV